MHEKTLKNWFQSSHLSKNNQLYIEKIYEDFIDDPNSVDSYWNNFFKNLSSEQNVQISTDLIHNKNIEFHKKNIAFNKLPSNINNIQDDHIYTKVLKLINSFRIYGHQYAQLDPLKMCKKEYENDLLKLEHYNFQSYDFEKNLNITCFGIQIESIKLLELHQLLKKIYCNTIGIEYMHVLNTKIISWIQNHFEHKHKNFLSCEEKKQIFSEIVAAEGIENYLNTKFPGTKRFSLEGGDALIPMLKEIIRYSVNRHNIKEIFLGMAHRGRLNVLINILGKSPKDLFNEFSGKQNITLNNGDVKYHQGLHSEITVNKNVINLSLLPNPSHLEIISPVTMGVTRARIDQYNQLFTNHSQEKNKNTLSVIIHGDAAISGQGIVQETFNMSKTRAYNVKGTIHIVINNQVGFTTSNTYDIRSTEHCTDIAKMIQIPIFHVNADDVDSVIAVTRAALNFRNIFEQDIIINLICYRRYGHNETDEPNVTQPIMYKKISNHPTLLNIYSNHLIDNNIITAENITQIKHTYLKKLNENCCMLQTWKPIYVKDPVYMVKNNDLNEKNTSDYLYKSKNLHIKNLAYHINKIPSYIMVHPRVKKIYKDRIEMASEQKLFDWGGAETLAYATLLDQGISIRLSGEDSARGTFFHRHAIIYDQNNGTEYIPLMNIKKNQGSFFIWNSVLSEEAALAFEYGYSSTATNTLVIWEAQFGDFSNGAQIVIDQFISSGEQKWGQLCNLVMLLPHGYEGQGPEHSSTRIERYLQLCAEENMKICIPSTPAQIYHILRQQALSSEKKPLIIISPKSLLRHPIATSTLTDLINGSFKKVLNEVNNNVLIKQINRIIMCAGKVYYDLISQKYTNKQNNVTIIRIEQLYPFPYEEVEILLNSYMHIKKVIWCQEEPKNQGAWNYIQNYFFNNFPNITLNYIGRSEAVAPAVGYFSIHQKQQKKLICDALNFN